MDSSRETYVRYGLIGTIWVGVLLFSFALTQIGAGGSETNVTAISIAALVCAAAATGFLLNSDWERSKAAHTNPDAGSDETGKRKNEQRGIDPMSLLTDEDVAELRQEIKYDLRRRLLQGEDGELNSIDALLAEQHRAERR